MFALESNGSRDKYRFNVATVVETEEELASRVCGSFGLDVLEVIEVVCIRKVFTQAGWQVAHLLDVADALLVDPLQSLFDPIRLLSHLSIDGFQISEGITQER